MVRTQIQLTEQQSQALRSISAARRLPIAELIRISIDAYLQREAGVGQENKIARAKSVAGRFASSPADVSLNHDRYLADAFSQE